MNWLHLFDQNTLKTIILWNIIKISSCLMYIFFKWQLQSLELHGPSEIMLISWYFPWHYTKYFRSITKACLQVIECPIPHYLLWSWLIKKRKLRLTWKRKLLLLVAPSGCVWIGHSVSWHAESCFTNWVSELVNYKWSPLSLAVSLLKV